MVAWTDNLIDIRRRLAVTSNVTTAARQHGLPERVIREVRRYAVNLLRQNVSASRAIHLAKHYRRCTRRPPTSRCRTPRYRPPSAGR